MSLLTDAVYELSGWTAEEIYDLVHNKQCPDHWHSNPVPNFALLELIRNAIDSSDISYRQGFPQVLDTLGLKHPKHLVGLISKIKHQVSRAETTKNFIILCEEVPGLSEAYTELIGEVCTSLNITPSWLETDDKFRGVITNQAIIELRKYRARKNVPWKTVVEKWWCKLFPDSEPPPLGTVNSSWDNLAAKKVEITHNCPKKEKEKFLAASYNIPTRRTNQERPNIETDSDDDSVLSDVNQNNDSGYESLSDDGRIHYLLRSHGDTMAILHELLEQEKEENLLLKTELGKETELRKTAEKNCDNITEDLKKSRADRIQLTDQYKKEVSKYKIELKKAAELSETLQKEIRSLTASNVVRRLQTAKKQLENEESKTKKLKNEVDKLKGEIRKLKDDLDEKRRLNKNKTEQLRYHRLKRTEDQAMSEVENTKLRLQLKDLERENDNLRSDLDEIMGDKEITTFDEGRYTEDIRVVCYELISRGVGSRHVSDIIRLVLKRIGGIDCGRLPKPTLIRLMAFEQALLAKDAARNAIENCEVPITLQTDGTSKKHIPYVTMIASTDTGTYGLGLNEVRTENSEILLEQTISSVQELLSITDMKDDEVKVNNLLLKIKNTMTDRCVVNKKFIELLEQWREQTLPTITDNWNELNQETRDNLAAVNDLYCGKHVILNLQEYAGAALTDWEHVETGGQKLGREKHIIWSRGKESATLLAVRTVCEAFGPDANAQAGAPIEFNDCMSNMGDKSRLKAYRGNRFNIPFENAAATYYHHHKGHISSAHDSLPENKQKNQLIRAVKYDLDDKIIVSGIRAMGIINCHVTQPVMQMLDRKALHVMDTSPYYTKLHDGITKWMVDPQELMDDSAVLFQDIVPVRDDIHKELYAVVDEDVEFLTRQAVSIILHNMYVCVSRQLVDHLPGGKFHNSNETIRHETSTCPKDNVAAERVFAGLDHLKRKSPNMSTLAMQGVLLWTLNKTAQYVDAKSPQDRKQLINSVTKNRRHIAKLYQEKVADIKIQRNKEVENRKKAREAKELKIVAQTVANTDNVLKLCKFICKTADDVDKLRKQCNAGSLREALLSQIRYYKSVNRGIVKGSLFFVTSGGKPLSTDELFTRLKEIVSLLNPIESVLEAASSSSMADDQLPSKETGRAELKEKLLAKLKSNDTRGTKRKNPFPQNIVEKRIRHTCLSPCGTQLEVYKGTVVRESTADDIEELMEEEYRSYLEKGYKFYTVIYDPPYDQLFSYPLKKEWDDGLLAIL